MAETRSAELLVASLGRVLQDILRNPCPIVPSPAGLKKRASVAVIIRIKPNYAQWPSAQTRDANDDHLSDLVRMQKFFEQKWVEAGDPEILFIKRAARTGDKWTGHVALPGGGKDPEDADDEITAIRETLEEVGIDLKTNRAISAGTLPGRLVTTSWGRTPLMILSPYVFLLTQHDIPPLRLQPTEVASAHWVPLRALLTPATRTMEVQDVSSHIARQDSGIKRWFMRTIIGDMIFAAIRLVPSESVHSSMSGDFLPMSQPSNSPRSTFRDLVYPVQPVSLATDRPLLLWGLTLGVMCDFLELLPPNNALRLWKYPTFSPPDVRFMIWALSHDFRRKNDWEISFGVSDSSTPMNGGSRSWTHVESRENDAAVEVGISGLGSSAYYTQALQRRQGDRASAAGKMLEGYYDYVRQGVAAALLGRVALCAALAAALWNRYR